MVWIEQASLERIARKSHQFGCLVRRLFLEFKAHLYLDYRKISRLYRILKFEALELCKDYIFIFLHLSLNRCSCLDFILFAFSLTTNGPGRDRIESKKYPASRIEKSLSSAPYSDSSKPVCQEHFFFRFLPKLASLETSTTTF